MTRVPGLRERKKEATRHDLMAAALRLTGERGLERVTVDDIAAAAGVSARTFFNYFASKEDAIVGRTPDREAELRADLAARPAGEPPLESLRAVLAGLASRFADRADEMAARLQVIHDNPSLLPGHLALFDSFEQLLREAVAARTGTDADRDLYPALVAAAAVAALRVTIDRWEGRDRDHDIQAGLDAAFAALAGGLVPPASAEPLSTAPTPTAAAAAAASPERDR